MTWICTGRDAMDVLLAGWSGTERLLRLLLPRKAATDAGAVPPMW